MEKYKSLLKTTSNTRELGGIITRCGVLTQKNKFWRSDAQNSLNEADIRALTDNKMYTILDLRTADEVRQSPNSLADYKCFRYISAPIVIGAEIPKSVEQVPVSYFEMTTAKVTMSRIFSVLADADGGVVFNCSAGKDRTGVVSAILLMLADVDEDKITENYMLTKYYSKDRFELAKQKFPDIDTNIIIPSESYIRGFIGLFNASYGSAEGYFNWLQIGEKGERIKRKLLLQL